MNKLITAFATAAAVALLASSCRSNADTPPVTEQANPTQAVRFICDEGFDKTTNQDLPTTFGWNSRGKIAVIRWERNVFTGYPPQKRCAEVSPRFQTAYDNGSVKFLTNGRMNNQPVICTALEFNGDCADLLFTLHPNDDGLAILQQLEDTLNGRAVGGLRQNSSGDAQRYVEVDIEQFLDTAPVEKE
ncbi:MAG: COP23 domain-containing protein [Oscillatoria sp. PMC 1051.18]|nr:COP23 domain-containing protein [Oscillatoria sp. PMC 1050.18]MEC5029922.1 COP23 domain-containing protein [Oscillatoria sp. PMC 1051.18]